MKNRFSPFRGGKGGRWPSGKKRGERKTNKPLPNGLSPCGGGDGYYFNIRGRKEPVIDS